MLQSRILRHSTKGAVNSSAHLWMSGSMVGGARLKDIGVGTCSEHKEGQYFMVQLSS